MMTVLPEAKVLDEIVSKSVGTTAEDISVNGRTFFIQNNSANAVYFKEKNGIDATSSNAIKVAAGASSDAFIASTLSVIAGGANSAILIVYIK